MELLAGLLVLGPLAFLMVLIAIQTRRLWPLLPSGAGSVALPEAHDERRAS